MIEINNHCLVFDFDQYDLPLEVQVPAAPLPRNVLSPGHSLLAPLADTWGRNFNSLPREARGFFCYHQLVNQSAVFLDLG